jgi:hypothetical protein
MGDHLFVISSKHKPLLISASLGEGVGWIEIEKDPYQLISRRRINFESSGNDGTPRKRSKKND